ncbi:MAG: metallophosphoesterase family protein [Anaerolineaceae bacterium]|nr:metallophosphoesterase family protein [Anaerolineaceae bacterium]
MDKVAVISDIHGNLTALEAVLADIKRRGIETIYCLGDLAGKGPQGAAVIDRCRQVCTAVVRGNWDEMMGSSEEHPALRWHQAQLGRERIDYLCGLDNVIDLWLSGRPIRLYHASAESVFVRVYPDSDPATHLGMFANTDFTGTAVPAPTVVGYGDIHSAYVLSLYQHQKTLFNVGSVGNPLDEPLATYAILEGVRDSRAAAPFAVQLVRLPYDIEGEIAIATDMQMPELEPYAKELRTAVYRGRQ